MTCFHSNRTKHLHDCLSCCNAHIDVLRAEIATLREQLAAVETDGPSPRGIGMSCDD